MNSYKAVPLFFSVVLVLALSSLAVTHTLWFENLEAVGTVKTGELSGGWTKVRCTDVESKDVGATLGTIEDATHLKFTIDNAYPGYTGRCSIEYTNTGTIPVRVDYIAMTPGENLTNCDCRDRRTGTTTCTCDQLRCQWTRGPCKQLHAGDEQAGTLRCKLLQPARMGASYDFGLVLGLVQYNESACPGR